MGCSQQQDLRPLMGSSVLKVSLWPPGLALSYSNTHKGLGSGCIPADLAGAWNVSSPAAAESIFPSLAKCQSGTRCFLLGPGLVMAQSSRNSRKSLCYPGQGDGCCCLLQLSDISLYSPREFQQWRFLSAAAGTRSVRAVPATGGAQHTLLFHVPPACALRAVWLCLSWGTALMAWQRCWRAVAPLSRSLPSQGKALAYLGAENVLFSQGFCHSSGKITHSNSLIFVCFVICLPPQ